MPAPAHQHLLSLIPDVDHPTLNAMRNSLRGDKISIPVRLYHNGQQVYAAQVRMIGHTHALYRAALDATLASLATRSPAIAWDEVSFHSDKKMARADALRDEASLSAYIGIYRKIEPHLAIHDAIDNLATLAQQPAAENSRVMFEHALLRLCAAIISTSVEVAPDPAYAPSPRKGLLARWMPRR